MGGVLKFKLIEHARVEKYAPGVTQEQIDSGMVAPIEVTEGDRETEVTAEQLISRGFDPEKIVRLHQQKGEGI